jgi:hypothetical protein
MQRNREIPGSGTGPGPPGAGFDDSYPFSLFLSPVTMKNNICRGQFLACKKKTTRPKKRTGRKRFTKSRVLFFRFLAFAAPKDNLWENTKDEPETSE